MNAGRFDSIAKQFADNRLTRRKAITQAGSGFAAGALAAAGMATSGLAQDTASGTPTAGETEPPVFLFLQAFQSGSVTPADDEEGRYTLTLERGLGYTVYFSDRPERIVGAHPTPHVPRGTRLPRRQPAQCCARGGDRRRANRDRDRGAIQSGLRRGDAHRYV